MRQAPVLERLDGRPAARLDVGENFDGGGDARGGDHGTFGLSGEGSRGRKSDTIAPHLRRAAARPYQGNDRMSKLLGATIALALALAVSLAAKTQLETGKTY